jgi:hypothetical protein
MTTKPNTKDKSDYANNYFFIPNDSPIYKLGLRDIIVDDEKIDCCLSECRISIQLPSTDGLKDYGWLVNVIEQKLMSMNVPYNDIRRISKFFAGIEDEITDKILEVRRQV